MNYMEELRLHLCFPFFLDTTTRCEEMIGSSTDAGGGDPSLLLKVGFPSNSWDDGLRGSLLGGHGVELTPECSSGAGTGFTVVIRGS